MKKLLFSGANGFVGSELLPILKNNYIVSTLGLGNENTYNYNLVSDNFEITEKFEVVLHAAGKAHTIPRTPEEVKLFFDVNFTGTINLCNSLDKNPPNSFIFLSSVAVYGCESGSDISEDHALIGSTPYAKSKIMAENFLKDWSNRNGVCLTILRPSLLAGKNPPGNLGSMITGIKTNRYFSIAGGRARKSIAMASDIANIIPYIENRGGIFNLCDGYHPSFNELEHLICNQLNIPTPYSIPMWFAILLAKVGDFLGNSAPINSEKLNKITKDLTFSNKKLVTELNFSPTKVLENFRIY